MTIDLTERQFHALAFAVGEARLRLIDDCGYTETEVEALRQAVSGTHPQEVEGMSYHYFVSYAYIGNSQGTGWGFGHICIVRSFPIRIQEDLDEARDHIESVGLYPHNVCILNFTLLP